MAWNTFHFTLSPGHSMEPGYSWGDDHGPQMALPREFTGSTRNNLLTASSQSVFRDSSNHLTYFVNVTNRGGNVATFELMGGGLG
jgi:hypothetical protein